MFAYKGELAMPKKKTALTIEERLQQALVPAEEQPYEVPKNWVWVRLGAVCFFENGYAFKSSEYVSSDGIRIIRIANVQDGYIEDKLPQYYPIKRLKPRMRFEGIKP